MEKRYISVAFSEVSIENFPVSSDTDLKKYIENIIHIVKEKKWNFQVKIQTVEIVLILCFEPYEV